MAPMRQEFRRHALGHEQALAGVTGAVFLGLGVVGDAHRHGGVAGVVDVYVTVAVQVLEHRHFGVAADALDQAFATAWDGHVDILGHADEVAYHLALGGLHQLHAVGRQGVVGQRPLHQERQRAVGIDCLRAAPQDAGIAALDGQAGSLDGHVGAAFEHHGEDPDRHPHLAHADAAGLLLHADDVADHIGHGGELFAALGHGVDDLRGEFQPVDHRSGQAGGLGARDVLLVLGVQVFQVVTQQLRQAPQGGIAAGSTGPGHQAGCGACLDAEGLAIFGDGVRGHGRIFSRTPVNRLSAPRRVFLRSAGTPSSPADATPASRWPASRAV